MLIEHTWRLKERRDVDLTNDKLEFYVDLWNNFYKSELLDNVHINYVDMKSYVKSFYMTVLSLTRTQCFIEKLFYILWTVYISHSVALEIH